ncbi:MAG TPA: SGNH/GDSL hydrolase family protein [Pseudonocardia sp.]|jgi:lysophospholipase L1-like esterase|nr:SGNH/GDSL hydrolase family protein [Pseudonocardia sp.]
MATASLTALGDSFVAGHGDPAEEGGLLGWPSRFAERLGLPQERCRNLGSYGSTTQDVVDRQLGAALVNKAPLVGVGVGVNDLISDYDPTRFRRNLELIFSTLSGPSTVVFTATYPLVPRIAGLPPAFRDMVGARFDEANEFLREVTDRYGLLCLDIARAPEWHGPELWSADGLHPGPVGHRWFADEMAELVGQAEGLAIEPAMRGHR